MWGGVTKLISDLWPRNNKHKSHVMNELYKYISSVMSSCQDLQGRTHNGIVTLARRLDSTLSTVRLVAIVLGGPTLISVT